MAHIGDIVQQPAFLDALVHLVPVLLTAIVAYTLFDNMSVKERPRLALAILIGLLVLPYSAGIYAFLSRFTVAILGLAALVISIIAIEAMSGVDTSDIMGEGISPAKIVLALAVLGVFLEVGGVNVVPSSLRYVLDPSLLMAIALLVLALVIFIAVEK